MNIPGTPAAWVNGGILAAVALVALPSSLGLNWHPALLLTVPVAMFAAVIAAYQEAARLRPGAPGGELYGEPGGTPGGGPYRASNGEPSRGPGPGPT